MARDTNLAEPLTVEHFRSWAEQLELDSGEPYIVEDYFAAFLEDYFAGIPELWLIVPEGNAKTTNLAGLAVYLLEFRRRAAIPWAAASRDQAEIGYRQAEGFVKSNPRLSNLFVCQEGYRRIKRRDTGARIQIFAAEADTGDGIIPTDAIIDELHRHKSLKLYETWRGKLAKRGGQLSTISTAGEPGSDFEAARERIRQEVPVIERRPGYIRCRSERVAFHEHALPEGSDVEDMAEVKLANPFSKITVETLRAKRDTPTLTIAHWRRFTCNLATREENAAIQETEWYEAKVDDEIPAGEPIWLGLDVAFKWDTTALVPLWWRDPEYRLLGEATILTPPRDGTSLSTDEIKRAIVEIHARNPIHTVVMDPSSALDLSQWIASELGAVVVERQQTNSLAVEDYERFMEALRDGRLKHTGDVGLTRHALNAVAHVLPYGDARFDRPSQVRRGGNQERRVIDALTAASMVHTLASQQQPAEPVFAWA